MNSSEIGAAVELIEGYYRDKAPPGPQADISATAMIEKGLRCRIEAPDGYAIHTDMPTAVGGGASCPSPGWHFRAALASCDATLLAMRAARLGIELDDIRVRVETSSDGRGMFLDEGISPGSTEVRIYFRLSGDDLDEAAKQSLVDWVVEHSPVGTDVVRAVDVSAEIETG